MCLFFANPDYEDRQMVMIRNSLVKGYDVTPILDPSIPYEEMAKWYESQHGA